MSFYRHPGDLKELCPCGSVPNFLATKVRGGVTGWQGGEGPDRLGCECYPGNHLPWQEKDLVPFVPITNLGSLRHLHDVGGGNHA